MFGSTVLEVCIGLTLVYLLLSLVCSSINEFIGRLMSWRSRMLEAGIKAMLQGLKDSKNQDVGTKIFANPLIKGLIGEKMAWTRRDLKPTYIPSRTFALALLDIVAPSPTTGPSTFTSVRSTVAALPATDMRTSLLGMLDAAEGDLKHARENIERWFDSSMDEVSAWYKRTANTWLFGVAVAVCFIMNADSIAISTALWRDPTLRAAVVAEAQKTAEHPPSGVAAPQVKASGDTAPSPVTKYKDVENELQDLKIPIGWSEKAWNESTWNTSNVFSKLLGLLFTAVAVSLGAPFWFDLLNKLVNFRASGNKPERTPTVEPPKAATASPQPIQLVVTTPATAGATPLANVAAGS
jgi:hypothetical protein